MISGSEIAKVVSGIPVKDRTPEIIAKVVCKFLEIDGDIQEIRRLETKAKEDFHATILELHRRKEAVSSNCAHESRSYYPDPSGNNDSSWECNICGAEVGRPTS